MSKRTLAIIAATLIGFGTGALMGEHRGRAEQNKLDAIECANQRVDEYQQWVEPSSTMDDVLSMADRIELPNGVPGTLTVRGGIDKRDPDSPRVLVTCQEYYSQKGTAKKCVWQKGTLDEFMGLIAQLCALPKGATK